MTVNTIQGILGAFLSAHGKHDLATQAFESTDRKDWLRLGDEAMRSAPEHNRTHVAHIVKLALDSPANGGPGEAQDFEIRRIPHPLNAEQFIFKAYFADGKEAGFSHHDVGPVARRLVGMYVVRCIQYPEGEEL